MLPLEFLVIPTENLMTSLAAEILNLPAPTTASSYVFTSTVTSTVKSKSQPATESAEGIKIFIQKASVILQC